MAKAIPKPKPSSSKAKSSGNKWKKILEWIKVWTIRAVVLFFVSSVLVVLLYKFINPPITFLMIKRCGEQVLVGDQIKLKKEWKDLDEISPLLPVAVMASEDQKFLDHSGFDFEAIMKAMSFNQKHKKVKGGSTISQQTAKNVFLWPGRSYIRKALEAYFTLLIEIFWSKHRIMEVYLNVIEMGRGVYGAESASEYYFQKKAKVLNREEAALIAAVLPLPLKYPVKKPSPYILKRKRWILANMNYMLKQKTPDFGLKSR